jgi:hypothetical protein
MKSKPSITINGRMYDAITGMPIAQSQSSAPHTPVAKPQSTPQTNIHRAFTDVAAPASTTETPFKKMVADTPKRVDHSVSQTIHRQPQKSQTLYRGAVKRPTLQAHVQSPTIRKFAESVPAAPKAVVQAKPIVPPVNATDTAPQATPLHPAVAKALSGMQQRQAPAKPPQPQSSKELKQALIKERLAEAEQKSSENEKRKTDKGSSRRRPRLATILTSSLAVLVLGGYLTYINLPNISMRVAATHSGVAATFPGYQPDGYSFQGPITYSPGEVSINFKSNTNNTSFMIKQKTSNWDSQAVLDNYISKQTENYMTQQEQGLTIYSFENRAAWVNGGLLYTVEGNAQLSSEQVLRLATSM